VRTQTKNKNERINWLVSGILVVVGLVIITFAILNFNQAAIIVEWSTASEIDTVGYNLSRANVQEGDRTTINEEMIPASTDPLTGDDYSFEDKNVTRGETYHYWLEEIETSGKINIHGPITETATNASIVHLVLGITLIVSGGAFFWLQSNPSQNQE